VDDNHQTLPQNSGRVFVYNIAHVPTFILHFTQRALRIIRNFSSMLFDPNRTSHLDKSSSNPNGYRADIHACANRDRDARPRAATRTIPNERCARLRREIRQRG